MNLGRRGMLKLMGVAPAAAPAIAAAMSTGVAGVGVVGLGARGLESYAETPMSVGPSAPTRFMDFAKWLTEVGDREARERAKDVRGLDPDIALMSVPLNTKVIWQRERNYNTIINEKRDWFGRRLSKDGFVEDWS